MVLLHLFSIQIPQSISTFLFRERWSQQITHDGPFSLAYYTRCHNLYQHFCLFSDGLSKQPVVVLLIWLGIQESIIQIVIVGHKCIWWSFFFSFSESDGLKQQLWILWIDMEYRMPQFIICCLYRDRLIKQHMVVHLHWLGIQNATIHIRMFIHIVLVSTNKTLMVLLQWFDIQDLMLFETFSLWTKMLIWIVPSFMPGQCKWTTICCLLRISLYGQNTDMQYEHPNLFFVETIILWIMESCI